ncbi:hypothetical protein [Pontibacter pamirensis]|uniref:hypothetical protein n=1 Tax=Pontibacter pamirensis TaxID=2562824 RepID=UPI001389E152|nr:hypothetical protein [Pontibacter pamirensis]
MAPPKKKPLTKSNTYKRKQKATNTYRKGPERRDNQLLNLAVLAAMVGGAVALVQGAKAGASNQAAPQATGSSPAKAPAVVPRPTPAPAPGPVAVTTAPTAPAVRDQAFVDSWNGEGLYAGTSPSYNPYTGNGRGHIKQAGNETYVGQWTGHVKDKMLQLKMTAVSGKTYSYWIAKDQVQLYTFAEANQRIANGSGSKMPADLRQAIENYFNK